MDSEIRRNTYELLSMSDSDDSNSSQHIHEINHKLPRRKRLRKKLPSYRIRQYDNVEKQKCCQSYGKLLSLSFTIIILCCWLVILSWLIVIFNDELKRFDLKVMEIVAGNKDISEPLLRCQTETKQLKKNQTELNMLVVELNLTLFNLSKEVFSITEELISVKSKLNSSLNLNIPSNLIEYLNNSVTNLKASHSRLVEDFHALKLNVTSQNGLPSSEIVPSNEPQKLLLSIRDLSENVTYLNNSLFSELELVKENQLRDNNITDDLKNIINQNITVRLDTIFDKINEFSVVSDKVNNLTFQFDLSNARFNKLLSRVNQLENMSNIPTG